MKPDTELVALAKAGDYQAFEQLVSRYERRLYGLALNILRSSHDAEDVVQNSFLAVMEHLADFREEASFATWIMRITTNKALNLLRNRKNSISLNQVTEENEDGIIPHPEYIADWRGNPGKLFEQRELRSILNKAIDTLPEKQRLVFVLRDQEGMSVSKTSAELNISPANVKVRLLRARLALREELTQVFGDKKILPGHHKTGNYNIPLQDLPAG